eukprot:3639918-Amphidinium_carterae.1
MAWLCDITAFNATLTPNKVDSAQASLRTEFSTESLFKDEFLNPPPPKITNARYALAVVYESSWKTGLHALGADPNGSTSNAAAAAPVSSWTRFWVALDMSTASALTLRS